MNNNHIILNKKDGKTIHYMNCRVHIYRYSVKVQQYEYNEMFKKDILVNTIEYNIDEIKSIEIGE